MTVYTDDDPLQDMTFSVIKTEVRSRQRQNSELLIIRIFFALNTLCGKFGNRNLFETNECSEKDVYYAAYNVNKLPLFPYGYSDKAKICLKHYLHMHTVCTHTIHT